MRFKPKKQMPKTDYQQAQKLKQEFLQKRAAFQGWLRAKGVGDLESWNYSKGLEHQFVQFEGQQGTYYGFNFPSDSMRLYREYYQTLSDSRQAQNQQKNQRQLSAVDNLFEENPDEKISRLEKKIADYNAANSKSNDRVDALQNQFREVEQERIERLQIEKKLQELQLEFDKLSKELGNES